MADSDYDDEVEKDDSFSDNEIVVSETADDVGSEPADDVGSELADDNDEYDLDKDFEEFSDFEEFDEFDQVDAIETGNSLHKEIIIVDPEKRKTSNIMTNYELTEAITIRASQLQKRFIPLTNVEGLTDAKDMAIKELKDGKSPLFLRRKVGEVTKNGKTTEYYEYWDVNVMSKVW